MTRSGLSIRGLTPAVPRADGDYSGCPRLAAQRVELSRQLPNPLRRSRCSSLVISTILINANGVVFAGSCPAHHRRPGGTRVLETACRRHLRVSTPIRNVKAPGFSVSVIFNNTDGLSAGIYGYLAWNQ
jgi:hypothetical protein